MGKAKYVASYLLALSRLRLAYRRRVKIEVAYDPRGMWISDMSLFRPTVRLAHLHESLHDLESHWLLRRVKRSIQAFSAVIVPDANRAEYITSRLPIHQDVLVVPNFPLARRSSRSAPAAVKSGSFDVVYTGSIGRNQQMELIMESVCLWPDSARLLVYGDDTTPYSKELRKKYAGEKILFRGWRELDHLLDEISGAWLAISLLDPTQIQWQSALNASNKRFIYMEAGLPQIGDTNPGVSALIEEKHIGSCVRSNEAAEVARIVTEYEADRKRALVEGARARQLFVDVFNYEVGFAPLHGWLVARGLMPEQPAPRNTAS